MKHWAKEVFHAAQNGWDGSIQEIAHAWAEGKRDGRAFDPTGEEWFEREPNYHAIPMEGSMDIFIHLGKVFAVGEPDEEGYQEAVCIGDLAF